MNITITLTEEQWNVVLGALLELPGKTCLPIVQEIQMQAVKASIPPAPAVTEEEESDVIVLGEEIEPESWERQPVEDDPNSALVTISGAPG